MLFGKRMCILISILLIVTIFVQIFTVFSMKNLLRNFTPAVKQIAKSENGNEVTMTIQSKATEVSEIINMNHSQGEYTNGQERQGREYKETVVVGILSEAQHFCLREAQRKTFISKAKAYKLLNIQVFFLLDEKTIALEKEQEITRISCSLTQRIVAGQHILP